MMDKVENLVTDLEQITKLNSRSLRKIHWEEEERVAVLSEDLRWMMKTNPGNLKYLSKLIGNEDIASSKRIITVTAITLLFDDALVFLAADLCVRR